MSSSEILLVLVIFGLIINFGFDAINSSKNNTEIDKLNDKLKEPDLFFYTVHPNITDAELSLVSGDGVYCARDREPFGFCVKGNKKRPEAFRILEPKLEESKK